MTYVLVVKDDSTQMDLQYNQFYKYREVNDSQLDIHYFVHKFQDMDRYIYSLYMLCYKDNQNLVYIQVYILHKDYRCNQGDIYMILRDSVLDIEHLPHMEMESKEISVLQQFL